MMKYKGYIGRVEVDTDAKILHGQVIGLRDVITFQADTPTEIEQAFRDSVDDYLEFCHARGESPDKPYSGQFIVRLQPSLHRRLSMLAEEKGKSLNAVTEELLDKATPERPTREIASPVSAVRPRRKAAR